ncbi:MAG: hypothetical protein ACRDKX_02215, partial [Solirubrobacterales bacterium]
CGGAPSRRPAVIAPYVEAARAVARRYGRRGTFWREHPALPERAVQIYEIWNEPNLIHGWCPEPEPERYARMFVSAAAAIRSVDPRAAVIVGGVGHPRERDPSQVEISSFFAEATAAEAGFARAASAVAVHTNTPVSADGQARQIAQHRAEFRAGGIPDSTPIAVNEIGWTTRGVGGIAPVTEGERAAAYAALPETLARTNCNLSSVLQHTWISAESDSATVKDWFGIVDPLTAVLYSSAQSYSAGIALMRGELDREGPRETIMACPGMPKPDQDADAVRDELDYHPVDRGRVTKGGRLTNAECSVRMIFLRERMRGAGKRESSRLGRRYARLADRCVRCKRGRLGRLERRILGPGDPDKALQRRVKHRRAVGSCRSRRGRSR